MNTAMMKKNVKGMFASLTTFQKLFMFFSPKTKKSFSKKPSKGNSLKISFKDLLVPEKRLIKSYGRLTARLILLLKSTRLMGLGGNFFDQLKLKLE